MTQNKRMRLKDAFMSLFIDISGLTPIFGVINAKRMRRKLVYIYNN